MRGGRSELTAQAMKVKWGYVVGMGCERLYRDMDRRNRVPGGCPSLAHDSARHHSSGGSVSATRGAILVGMLASVSPPSVGGHRRVRLGLAFESATQRPYLFAR